MSKKILNDKEFWIYIHNNFPELEMFLNECAVSVENGGSDRKKCYKILKKYYRRFLDAKEDDEKN